MSLPRLTFLCHLSSSTNICQIPELCSLKNPMQPPISRWYNPDKRCDVMVGSSTISSDSCKNCKNWVWKLVSKRQLESVKEGVISYIVPWTSSEWHVDRECLAKRIYCQKNWFKNGDEMSIILFWNSAFCFGITSHPSTKHALFLSFCCFEINRCLAFYFDKIFWSNSNMQQMLINPKD